MSQPQQVRSSRPAVVFQPNLIDGINLIADAIRPTLGPLPRMVGIENTTNRERTPEVLDNAGVIARRIIQLGDPTVDAGAMMMRHAVWRMHETCGDGAATAAVLAQAMCQQAAKAVAAGAHPALIRQGIERGAEQAAAALRAQAVRFPGGKAGRDLLAKLARTLCPDKELADVLVEIVEITGMDGAAHVVNNDGRTVEREYVEGAMWESPWLTTGFTTDPLQTIARIEDATVILLDGAINSAQHAMQGLQTLHQLGRKNVVIIADNITDEAKSIFIQAQLSGMFKIVPIKAPLGSDKRAMALADMSALTSAQILFGDSIGFANITEADLGEVRRAWATSKQFGLIAGRRDPVALRTAISNIRHKIEHTENLDEIAELRMRLGRLCGGLAIVRVGAATSKIQEERKDQAIRLSRALQMAIRRGIVAGGGAALLQAANAIRTEGEPLDVAFGLRAVQRGLEAPMTAIAANAGHDPSAMVNNARIASRLAKGVPHGLNARTGHIVDLVQAGVVDSAETVERALHIAASLAAITVTTDAIVHHRNPSISAMP